MFKKGWVKALFRRKHRRPNQALEKVSGHPTKKKHSTILRILVCHVAKTNRSLPLRNHTHV